MYKKRRRRKLHRYSFVCKKCGTKFKGAFRIVTLNDAMKAHYSYGEAQRETKLCMGCLMFGAEETAMSLLKPLHIQPTKAIIGTTE